MKLIIYIDGACRFNPGPAGIGVWIGDDKGRLLKEVSHYIGEATNNIAEWQALIRALEEAREIHSSELNVFTDSRLLYEQMRGTYRVREPKLRELYAKAKRLEEDFQKVHLSLVPREKNKLADRLAKGAIKKEAVDNE